MSKLLYPSSEAPERSPHAQNPASLRDDARSSVIPLSALSARVRMEGYFKPTWMAGLCGGLSERHVSIERVHATRSADGAWHAELDVSPPSTLDLASVPYVELADADFRTELGALQLESFQLTESDDHDGSLRLSFEAPDSLGLLGRVLGMLAMMGLFPVAMQIETRGGRARDTLWLSGMGRAAPSGQARQNLERTLHSMLKRSRPAIA